MVPMIPILQYFRKNEKVFSKSFPIMRQHNTLCNVMKQTPGSNCSGGLCFDGK